MPVESKRYIHRIGRTARGGSEGIAVSICNKEERQELKRIAKKNKDTLRKYKVKASLKEELAKKIEEIQPYIVEIAKQERLEKQIFLANVEMAKAENIIKYKDQIENRPKR